jgi:hypothetical protein
MQYLLQDLIKLPLSERLIIVEKLIGTMVHSDYEEQLKKMLYHNLETKSA